VTEYLTYTPIEWEGYTPYNQIHWKRRNGTGPVSDRRVNRGLSHIGETKRVSLFW